ncbi:MAG: ATP-binding cassette domain-containing protein, partial [Aestuariivirga sp.]
AAERDVTGVTRAELAELMVGRPIPQAKAEPQVGGATVFRLFNVSARRGSRHVDHIALELRGGEILGIAGVSGNGQSLLADIVGGVAAPASGSITLNGVELAEISPRVMVAGGMARIPEDRHAEGLIADMTVTENVISETYRSSRFARSGLIDWRQARAFAEKIIGDYAVKCPAPEAKVRLLSGGNMQKLILGRVMAGGPRVILANQPTRGLDVGAVSYLHGQLLEARKRGAAILLISEDLDELLSLADRVAVMHRGRLSPPMLRGHVTIQDLGLMMAGHGFEIESADAA